MVGETGFEPATPWSRTAWEPFARGGTGLHPVAYRGNHAACSRGRFPYGSRPSTRYDAGSCAGPAARGAVSHPCRRGGHAPGVEGHRVRLDRTGRTAGQASGTPAPNRGCGPRRLPADELMELAGARTRGMRAPPGQRCSRARLASLHGRGGERGPPDPRSRAAGRAGRGRHAADRVGHTYCFLSKGSYLNFWPPTLASYMRPPLATVKTATPF